MVLESEGQVRVGGWCDGGGTDRVVIKCGVGKVSKWWGGRYCRAV